MARHERRLTGEEKERGLRLLRELEALDQEHHGEDVCDSTDLIGEMHEERTRAVVPAGPQ